MTAWVQAPSPGGTQEGALRARGLSHLQAKILSSMGAMGADLALFLEGPTCPLPEPGRLPDMGAAVERVSSALRGGERILVHGDYDVDGLMGAAILVAGLRALGGEVSACIPSRFEGGYGLSASSVETAQTASASLMVTADCGTNAGEVPWDLKRKGIDLVVTDHHIPSGGWRPPGPFVNPHSVPGHPDRDLCGATVALQLLRACAEEMGRALPLDPFLRLCAVATIADVVPITITNRAVCRAGLRAFSESPNPALAALCQSAGIRPPIRSSHVGFALAPRFNAAGRMEDARLVLDLLLERDPAAAVRMVARLEALNRKRKAFQTVAYEGAAAQVAADGNGRVAFAASEGWHKGVIGPVAARLAEITRRSAFVVSMEGDEGTGSARAFEGDNVTDLLSGASSCLVRFGGHEAAAGFTVRRDCLDELRRSLSNAPCLPARGQKEEAYHPVEVEEIQQLWEVWGLLDPFGPNNKEPYLGIPGEGIESVRLAKGRHLIWRLPLPSKGALTLIAWDGVGKGFPESVPIRGRTFVGRPVPESQPGDLPFYFNVSEVL